MRNRGVSWFGSNASLSRAGTSWIGLKAKRNDCWLAHEVCDGQSVSARGKWLQTSAQAHQNEAGWMYVETDY
jgi:hypothetical protein